MATVHTADSRDGYTSRNASVGVVLKRARERRGLSLQEIARETKLPPRHLEALEQDNLAAVPSRFYQRAEIRAYAKAVGLDEHALLKQLDYEGRAGATRGPAVDIPTNKVPTFPRTYAVMAIAVVAVAAVLFGWTISQRAPTLDGSGTPTLTDTSTKSREPGSEESPQPAVLEHENPDPVAHASTNEASTTETSPVPVEPLPSANGATELVVTTEPAGARVTVNGIAWGVSPVTIRHLPAGDKRIRVTKEGFPAQERVLRVDAGRQYALTIPLESAP